MRFQTISALLLLGAASPHHTPSSNATLIASAKAAIEGGLRDPGSAQYRNVRVLPGQGGGKAVCGEVNATNGFGGYVGFTAFVFEAALDDARLDDGKDMMFDLYAKDCKH